MTIFPTNFTIKELRVHFSTDDQCLEYLFDTKYKTATNCPKCNRTFNYSRVKERRAYQCNHCNNMISPTASTIFHKSETQLNLWFYAIFLFCVSKNGVSAKELQRQTGVTYKTAWRMAFQIRTLFADDNDTLKGTVEIDEAYLGGKEDKKHESKKHGHKGSQGKTAVIGAVERGGNVRARVVDDTTRNEVTPFVRGKIAIDATVFTDEYVSYDNLSNLGYRHEQVNHSKKVYVDGNTHTNTIEGFWSQLKRSIDGTYHMVAPKHLQQYVNEFAWRYNRRNSKGLFLELVGRV